jgi:hypothetical protein
MEAGGGDVRVATWNAREGVPVGAAEPVGDGPSPGALTELVDLVHAQRIDVLALQGVDFAGPGRSAVLAALTGRTPLTEVRSLPLSDSSYFPGRLAGVAVASAYPMDHSVACLLPNPRLAVVRAGKQLTSHDKGLLSCVLDLGDRRVVVASLDMYPFGLFGRSADEQPFAEVWHELAYHLAALDLLPMVLAGAFQTPRRDLILQSRFKSTAQDGSGVDILHSAGLSAVTGPQVVPTSTGHPLYIADLSPER